MALPTHVFIVTRYADTHESRVLGVQYYGAELEAHQAMDRLAQRGEWSTLEVLPWGEAPEAMRCRILCHAGWKHCMEKVMQGQWSVDTSKESYKALRDHIDAMVRASNEAETIAAFRALWAYCRTREASAGATWSMGERGNNA